MKDKQYIQPKKQDKGHNDKQRSTKILHKNLKIEQVKSGDELMYSGKVGIIW